MADGVCMEDSGSNVFEKIKVKDFDNDSGCEKNDSVNDVASAKVKSFYMASDSDKLFDNMYNGNKHEGFLPCEDDCRKKRCVDRYDSSESSDSGVAVLSCTDCSGSSTASSDITDPGSPYSTSSSHSEDSGASSGQFSTKMPPTQTAHTHWPWTTAEDSGLSLKRQLQDKTACFKRLKSSGDVAVAKKSPSCLDSLNSKRILQSSTLPNPSPNVEKPVKNSKSSRKCDSTPKMQQGKITEYFKTHVKSTSIKKELSIACKSELKNAKLNNNKLISLVDPKLQPNNVKSQKIRKNDVKVNSASKKIATDSKSRKLSGVTVPRKILPAPSKIPDKLTINNHMNNITNFTPTVTLTTVGFPSNLTYLHAKGPKPADNFFVPQFTTISNDKISAIPIINRTPCLNVIQPVQKIATINNFNCVKLNATVVPIVKLNTLPSRINRSPNLANVALSVETAVPTVLSAKPKANECRNIEQPLVTINNNNITPKQNVTPIVSPTVNSVHTDEYRLEDEFRAEDQRTQDKCRNTDICSGEDRNIRAEEKSPTPDSDSGYSNFKDCLEVCVNDLVTEEPQKSPILSQPKTIRFPARDDKEDIKESKPLRSDESGLCRWTDCCAQFETSGALLEHLQEKHVISQATQEQYVCLWKGCKVFGHKSCSRAWLERHVLAHAGKKPFRCIVDGCGQRFNSQLMLERHVNSHFNSDGTQNNNAKKTAESSSSKLFKRNGKRIRFRRQPWSARMFDFIDAGIMEGLQYKLLTMTQKRTLGQIGNAGETVNLKSQVVARKKGADGSTQYLVRWHPLDIVPDEWINEKDYSATKIVSIPSLDSSSKTTLKPVLFPQKNDESRQKHRRKAVSKPT